MSLSFLTPIEFPPHHKKTIPERMMELADDFLYLGSRKAQVLSLKQKELQVSIVSRPSSCLSTCVKVALYFAPLLSVIAAIVNSHFSSLSTCGKIILYGGSVSILPAVAMIVKMYRWTYTCTVTANRISPSSLPGKNELIPLEAVHALGLNLEETFQTDNSDFESDLQRFVPMKTFTVAQAAEETIRAINKRQPGPAIDPNTIHLEILPWYHRDRNKETDNLCWYQYRFDFSQPTRMERILTALRQKGYIKSFDFARGEGFLIKM